VRGLVVRSTGSWYTVRTDEGREVACKVKGNFRLKGIRSTNPVAVGDVVQITVNPEGAGFIVDIEERRNYIIRRAPNLSKQSHILAANVDQVFLFVTIAHPETSTTFIDRFLAGAEAYRVPVVLLFNKTDLFDADELHLLDGFINLYTTIGYDCRRVSVERGDGIEELRTLLPGKLTLFAGNSGVGKTSLLNKLLPDLNLRTAELSTAHDTGQHTTTFSEMYPLPDGGYLIDTPGIKGFGTFDLEREEVGHYFRDIFQYAASCRFGASCTHTCEPGCAVKAAVEEHLISESRYASYLSMLGDKDEDKYRPAY
jgi:ribosome biogenesis GTPase